MKKFFTIFFMLLFNTFIVISQEWVQINTGTIIKDFTRSFAVQNGTIYAGVLINGSYSGLNTTDWTNSGIWYADMNNMTWHKANNSGLNNRFISRILKDNSNFWIGTKRYYSDSPSLNLMGMLFYGDINYNWTEMNQFTYGTSVTDDVQDLEKINGYIFICTYSGLYRCVNNTSVLSSITTGMKSGDKNITGITNNGYYLYCSDYMKGVYFSQDNGNNWTFVPAYGDLANSNVQYYNNIRFVDNNLFLMTDVGLFKADISNGSNIRWTKSTLGLTIPNGHAGIVNEMMMNNGILYAFCDDYVFTSENHGDTWTLFKTPPSEDNSSWMFHFDGNYLYGLFDGNLFRLLDTYTSVKSIVPEQVINNFKAEPNPANVLINFSYELINNENVELSIYDITGKEVYKINQIQSKGNHQIKINTQNLNEGFYITKLNCKEHIERCKILVKH